jgi:hypothetical protein
MDRTELATVARAEPSALKEPIWMVFDTHVPITALGRRRGALRPQFTHVLF